MKAQFALALSVALFAAGCSGSSSSPTTTSPTKPTFTAELKTSNEVPPIVGAEASGSGTASITFDQTANTVTFIVNLSGFPANTPINIAHIHTGTSGNTGSVLVTTTLAAGEVTLANGSGSFSKTAPVTADVAQGIINNPAGFYFNVHSTLNSGGVARGQLVRQ